MSDESTESVPVETRPPGWRGALIQKHRWLVFILPLAVYMAVGSLEPRRDTPNRPEAAAETADAPEPTQAGAESDKPAEDEASDGKKSGQWLPIPAIPYRHYPLVYTIKIALTLAAIFFVLPGYRQFPLHVNPLAVLVGAAGIIVWVGMCELHLEQRWLVPLGLDWFVGAGVRPGFDPFWVLADRPAWQLWGFLAVRLFGLVAVVALIEEFFLRGFLMRFVAANDWWEVPIGQASLSAVVACVAYGVLTHPGELFAAAAWFLLVTALAVKTRNIWDCVVAHATTNLLLGAYVVGLGQWQYW